MRGPGQAAPRETRQSILPPAAARLPRTTIASAAATTTTTATQEDGGPVSTHFPDIGVKQPAASSAASNTSSGVRGVRSTLQQQLRPHYRTSHQMPVHRQSSHSPPPPLPPLSDDSAQEGSLGKALSMSSAPPRSASEYGLA